MPYYIHEYRNAYTYSPFMHNRGSGVVQNTSAQLYEMIDRVIFYYSLIFFNNLLLFVGDRCEEKQSGLNSTPDDAYILKEYIDRAEKQIEAEGEYRKQQYKGNNKEYF